MFKVGDTGLTREGQKYRIICVDMKKDDYSMVAIIMEEDGWEHEEAFTKDGFYSCYKTKDTLDLMPPKMKRWINIYAKGEGFIHNTKAEAIEYKRNNCIAQKMIEYYEGEGL